MDLGVYNASNHYGDRIYSNTSGLIAGQSNGNSADRKVYDDEENYVIKHFETSEVSAKQRLSRTVHRTNYANDF